ncbi:MAG: hypothetical protein A2571_00360 [Candidatus Vogelbacteria bacterium RIFOXYD1_FULL_44_32]|uniref:Superinfection immunity protein n=1 Tax=Candidatus Vogelbacteria bacterium RIFOXYD1_FULL_44_32 TaxID=1802438 RepID=A0A1G2QE38_9BACT|nr:MAG: hypothetical protein A2571_00360 [Candidatus Vogelbacteria bacterium RIFOXYD1_FULL_44_32]
MESTFIALLIAIAVIGLYFAPSIGAFYDKKDNAWAIFALNLFLGWTFIGWVVALIWSLTEEKQLKS